MIGVTGAQRGRRRAPHRRTVATWRRCSAALGRAHGSGAHPRLHAPHRSLRRRLRARPTRSERAHVLDVLLDAPHGIDLGPLEPRLPEVLRTPTGMIELAPELIARRPGPPARRRSTGRSPELRADRPPRPAVEQLVDAQRRGAGEGQAALHAARPPRRRRPAGRGRRCGGAVVEPGRVGRRCRSRSPTRSGPAS